MIRVGLNLKKESNEIPNIEIAAQGREITARYGKATAGSHTANPCTVPSRTASGESRNAG